MKHLCARMGWHPAFWLDNTGLFLGQMEDYLLYLSVASYLMQKGFALFAILRGLCAEQQIAGKQT